MHIKKLPYKQQLAFLFGGLALISYLTISLFPKEKETASVVASTDHANVQVYLFDQEDTLVPVTFKMDPASTMEDRLQMMMDYMDGTSHAENFYPVFTSECILNGIALEGDNLILDFGEGFENYDVSKELKVLEAIVWGAVQFPEVKSVNLKYQGEALSKMPLGGTPIRQNLSQTMGINHFETATGSLYDSSEITVYYVKEIGDREFFVPKSKRIPSNDPTTEEMVQEMIADISASSGLGQPLHNDNIDVYDLPRDKGVLSVSVNSNILGDDRSVKQQTYDALVLSLATILGVDEIQVTVDDVVVSVHGSNEEVTNVGALVYNEID